MLASHFPSGENDITLPVDTRVSLNVHRNISLFRALVKFVSVDIQILPYLPFYITRESQ